MLRHALNQNHSPFLPPLPLFRLQDKNGGMCYGFQSHHCVAADCLENIAASVAALRAGLTMIGQLCGLSHQPFCFSVTQASDAHSPSRVRRYPRVRVVGSSAWRTSRSQRCNLHSSSCTWTCSTCPIFSTCSTEFIREFLRRSSVAIRHFIRDFTWLGPPWFASTFTDTTTTFGDSETPYLRLAGTHLPVGPCASEEHREGLGKSPRNAGGQAGTSRWSPR